MPWELIGNSGTNPTTNFLGTTDMQPLVIKTNAAEAMRINPNRNIGIGTANPGAQLHIFSVIPPIPFPEPGPPSITQLAVSRLFQGPPGSPDTEITDFILKDGNVGIGTINPSEKLEIAGGHLSLWRTGSNSTSQALIFKPHDTGPSDSLRKIWVEQFNMKFQIFGGSAEKFQFQDHNGNVHLTINGNGGNVGIGTTTPTAKLDVVGSTQDPGAIFNASNMDSGYAVYGSGGQGTTFGGLCYVRPGEPNFMIGVRGQASGPGPNRGVEGMSESGTGVFGGTTSGLAGEFSGPVLIRNQTTTPALRVIGVGSGNQDVAFGGNLVCGTGLPTQSAGPASIRLGADTANNDIEIGSSNPNIRDISFWNSAGGFFMNTIAELVYNTGTPSRSDARLKTDVRPLTDVIEKLEQIRGVSFEWNNMPKSPDHPNGRREVGVIAQEVERIFPELVTTWGVDGYKAVDYGRLAAVLVEAVKELRAENGMLRSRLETLERLVIKSMAGAEAAAIGSA